MTSPALWPGFARSPTRVTLSAAQLAVAREYGYRSWPALKAEVERRRLSQPAGKSPLPGGDEQGPVGVPGERWSFGGATVINTSVGVLLPEAVVVSGGHATLYASLMPDNSQPPRGGPHWGHHRECRSLAGPGAGGSRGPAADTPMRP
jgi:hypothetical protein